MMGWYGVVCMCGFEFYDMRKIDRILKNRILWHNTVSMILKNIFFKFLCYFFLERVREGERGENINVWLPSARPSLGTHSTTQACTLTGNRTSDTLVRRPALNPLSHTSQGSITGFMCIL